MLNHPSISNPDFSTIVLAWSENGPSFFPSRRSGVVLLDTYYLSYFLAILIAWLLFQYWRRRGSLKLWPWQIYDLAIITIVGILIGAKLFYVLFYFPEYYIENPGHILTNWSGMSGHGAFFGVTLGIWIYCRRSRINFLHVGDHAVLGAVWGAVFVRIANFLNGELYGRSAGEGFPLAMRFPMRDVLGQPLYLDSDGQIYSGIFHDGPERLRLLAEGVSRPHETYATMAEQLPQQTHSHLWPALPVEDGGFRQVVRLITDPSHPSQLYEVVLGGIVLMVILWIIRWRSKRVGTVLASFFVGYGFVRILIELVRERDIQRSTGIFEYISMGQIFSLGLIAFGVALLMHIRKSGVSAVDVAMPPRPVAATPPASEPAPEESESSPPAESEQ